MSDLRNSWRHISSVVLDLLYPPRCVGCDTRGQWFCEGCVQQLTRPQPPMCELCGNPLPTAARPASPRLCARCQAHRPGFNGLHFVAYFEGPLRQAVHRLKYQGCWAAARPLGQLMAATCQENAVSGDLLIPVPLHARRQRERGYNQAALLAQAVGQLTGMPVYPAALVRQRATQSQVQLNAQERQGNVRGAFSVAPAAPAQLSGRTVVLVDDVCTTGATLDACATVLRQAGATSVWALTLGRER
ncbi:MAG: ComF family protein [Chloroflexi bacterium]|nr:ComF family protein [Chloroflexota bacterium]MBU1751947.1 ComF family protein [Chloroflexota bacterium]MBU1878625.1 ComF family protein [Chloroflexota bacterium]